MACFLAAGHAAAKRSAGTVLRRRGFAASATARRHDDASKTATTSSLLVAWRERTALELLLSSECVFALAEEAVKWERITYAGIATCTVLAMFNLSKGHQEFPDPPPNPYLHIRNKDFPWGKILFCSRKENF